MPTLFDNITEIFRAAGINTDEIRETTDEEYPGIEIGSFLMCDISEESGPSYEFGEMIYYPATREDPGDQDFNSLLITSDINEAIRFAATAYITSGMDRYFEAKAENAMAKEFAAEDKLAEAYMMFRGDDEKTMTDADYAESDFQFDAARERRMFR